MLIASLTLQKFKLKLTASFNFRCSVIMLGAAKKLGVPFFCLNIKVFPSQIIAPGFFHGLAVKIYSSRMNCTDVHYLDQQGEVIRCSLFIQANKD